MPHESLRNISASLCLCKIMSSKTNHGHGKFIQLSPGWHLLAPQACPGHSVHVLLDLNADPNKSAGRREFVHDGS